VEAHACRANYLKRPRTDAKLAAVAGRAQLLDPKQATVIVLVLCVLREVVPSSVRLRELATKAGQTAPGLYRILPWGITVELSRHSLTLGRIPQCIMKERPLQKVEAGCGAVLAQREMEKRRSPLV
jgi:hypothetical protein